MRKQRKQYALLTGICVIGLGVLLAGKFVTDQQRKSRNQQRTVAGEEQSKNTGQNKADEADRNKDPEQAKKGATIQDNDPELAKKGETNGKNPEQQEIAETDSGSSSEQRETWINASGNTLETRILPPEGFVRPSADADSLTSFLRTYPMKKDGSAVKLYNGKKKGRQDVHAAIFKLPLEKEDLQQCADSVMRVYAEYYWHTGRKDQIAFHFVDGFLAEYRKWQQGYRIQIGESRSSWVKSASPDSSYTCFQKYLRIVFSYASTLSMEKESKRIQTKELTPGDIFIRGGSPGHVVMVVDMCEHSDGRKAFLLGQGYMPAQEFHVLKNPAHGENPWYYLDEVEYPFDTPEYTFEEGSLRRTKY